MKIIIYLKEEAALIGNYAEFIRHLVESFDSSHT